jgi:GxxExxY protein
LTAIIHDLRLNLLGLVLHGLCAMLASIGPLNQITSRIIAAAVEVHRALGPGLLESAYHTCLLYELRLADLTVKTQKRIPLVYKGIAMDCSYTLDWLIEDRVIGEIKSVERVLPVHEAQLMTQLKLAGKPVGLLLNFNVPVMKDGITRKLNRAALEV